MLKHCFNLWLKYNEIIFNRIIIQTWNTIAMNFENKNEFKNNDVNEILTFFETRRVNLYNIFLFKRINIIINVW